MPDLTKDFLGSGWKFPPQLDSRGRIALVHQEEDVEEAIKIILMTSPGERPMRPDFGCRLNSVQFEPSDSSTAGLARRYVLEALTRWEPRIEVTEVTCAPDPYDAAILRIAIQYQLLSDNSDRNLVFPYYMIPGE